MLNLLCVCAAFAQGTAFTYQGRLLSGALPASANYDFQFALYDSLSGGTQQGSTLTITNVAVASGIFTVTLDFGSQFPGAGRFLDISVRTAGGGAYTPLSPRQPITSSPYSVKSLNADNATNATNATTATNATQLGGVAANQFVQTGDARLTDARPPTAGSGNYVQNTNALQAGSNFNISGSGTAGGTLSAGVVNATTQYNIGGFRVLSNAGTGNLFAGMNAGLNTTGSSNSFVGAGAGQSNLGGFSNSFFGRDAGLVNTTGGNNNSFFGAGAGNANMGGGNTFVGRAAGHKNVFGSSNTIIGDNADVGNAFLQFATAIGAQAVVTTSDTIVLGRVSGSVLAPGSLTVAGYLTISNLGAVGSTNLCRNAINQISTCSSSLRYKTNLAPYRNGLAIISQLKPITFDWKQGGMHDLGFGAEDVAKIDPLLVTRNDKGEVEGVKYDRLSVVFVNAFKEQQAQIEAQQKQIATLLTANAALNTRLRAVEKRLPKKRASARGRH